MKNQHCIGKFRTWNIISINKLLEYVQRCCLITNILTKASLKISITSVYTFFRCNKSLEMSSLCC